MSENPYYVALYYMREHGWTQGAAFERDGRVCLLGALAGDRLTGALGWSIAICQELREVCKEQYGESIVSSVNDHLLTSQDQAEALLEKAAVRWDENHG